MTLKHRWAASALAFSISLSSVVPSWSAGSEPARTMTDAQANAIYRHLIRKHWMPKTGLFLSFADVGDRKLSQQSSTYEQGVIGLLLIQVGDLPRAKHLFQFLHRAWEEGPIPDGPRQGVQGLSNFYNAAFSGEGIEKTIHVGPNAWVGLFAARLGNRYGVAEATTWAIEMAQWMMRDVPHSKGGIAMGPLAGPTGIPWPQIFSVENNISYYAFLSELLRSTILTPDLRRQLEKEQEGVESWLVQSGFDRQTYTMKRGINPAGDDSIKALDTLSWLLSAVGPERLQQLRMDPYRLMDTIQRLFVVQADGKIGIDPTDQTEADRTARLPEKGPQGESPRDSRLKSRLLWYEGMGQYLTTLTLMAEYSERQGNRERAQSYQRSFVQLSEQFDKASLKNYPPGTAFTYATPGKFFHDGWWSPAQGTNGPASSLIATTWRLFAGLGVDPLSGHRYEWTGAPTVVWSGIPSVEREKASILFGTSEDMVVKAWYFLEDGQLNAAMAQATATIEEWGSFADDLQNKKQSKLGHLVDYAGYPEQRDEIFSYWALNDVAAAYYVMGKVHDERGEYLSAAKAFRQITEKYPLAQVWDPKGWFWSPAEAIYSDFAKRNPTYYGGLVPPSYAGPMEGKKAF